MQCAKVGQAEGPQGPASWSPATQPTCSLFRDHVVPAQFKVQLYKFTNFQVCPLRDSGSWDSRFLALSQKVPVDVRWTEKVVPCCSLAPRMPQALGQGWSFPRPGCLYWKMSLLLSWLLCGLGSIHSSIHPTLRKATFWRCMRPLQVHVRGVLNTYLLQAGEFLQVFPFPSWPFKIETPFTI